MSTADHAAAYARYFDTLTPASKPLLRQLAHPAIHFVDPFNDVRGIDKVEASSAHLFATTREPRFGTATPVVAGDLAFTKWRFTCRIERGRFRREITIDGVSEITIDEAGLVTRHIDYWDAAGQLYERLPLLGSLLRLVRRRLAVG